MEEINTIDENAKHALTIKPKKKKPDGYLDGEEGFAKRFSRVHIERCWISVYSKEPRKRREHFVKDVVFKGGRPTHSCSLYLDERRGDEIRIRLTDLLTRLGKTVGEQ